MVEKPQAAARQTVEQRAAVATLEQAALEQAALEQAALEQAAKLPGARPLLNIVRRASSSPPFELER